MAAPNRYYPGFFGALFLVLLRISIGWHFLYEGLDKYQSTKTGGKAFSAEYYLRASTGPLAPTFRSLVPDVDSLEKLDPARLGATFGDQAARVSAHFGLDANQREAADAEVKNKSEEVAAWFRKTENAEKVSKYRDGLAAVAKVDSDPEAMSFQRERAAADRKALEADRRSIVQEVDTYGSTLGDALVKLATPAQLAAAGAYAPPPTSLDLVNTLTMFGLMAVGTCLMLGFLTPLSALATAGYLAMFYLSMPPWPGLPENPMAEGHYWIVNKNLIEFLACLVLASTPNGLWIGVDALLFGRWGRKAPARAAEVEAPQVAGKVTHVRYH